MSGNRDTSRELRREWASFGISPDNICWTFRDGVSQVEKGQNVIAKNKISCFADTEVFKFVGHTDQDDSSGFSIARSGGFEEIEKVARKLRAECGYSSEARVDILDIVELKLPILFADFSFVVIEDDLERPDVLALTRVEPLEIVVKDTIYQQAIKESPHARFILAHELGHLILHRNYIHPLADLLLDQARSPDINLESQADWFAEAFLLPSEALSCTAPGDISAQYGVPDSVTRERLRRLGLGSRS
jgi:hypothetical protein